MRCCYQVRQNGAALELQEHRMSLQGERGDRVVVTAVVDVD